MTWISIRSVDPCVSKSACRPRGAWLSRRRTNGIKLLAGRPRNGITATPASGGGAFFPAFLQLEFLHDQHFGERHPVRTARAGPTYHQPAIFLFLQPDLPLRGADRRGAVHVQQGRQPDRHGRRAAHAQPEDDERGAAGCCSTATAPRVSSASSWPAHSRTCSASIRSGSATVPPYRRWPQGRAPI